MGGLYSNFASVFEISINDFYDLCVFRQSFYKNIRYLEAWNHLTAQVEVFDVFADYIHYSLLVDSEQVHIGDII